jgi:hypothetical protein
VRPFLIRIKKFLQKQVSLFRKKSLLAATTKCKERRSHSKSTSPITLPLLALSSFLPAAPPLPAVGALVLVAQPILAVRRSARIAAASRGKDYAESQK